MNPLASGTAEGKRLKAPSLSTLQVARFSDHDELTSLIQGADSEFIQRGPGAFSGRFTFMGLDDATLQFAEMDLPYLARGSPRGDRVFFVLHLKPKDGYVWKGRALPAEFIVVLPSGTEHQDITPAGTTWVALSFSRDRLTRVLETMDPAERPLDLRVSQVLLPRSRTFHSLRGQIAGILATIRADPSLLDVEEARRGMEESILSSLAAAVGTASPYSAPGYGAAARTRVTRRIEAYLSSSATGPIYLADLCAVAGVGERALRNIFQERYGMSPVRYLRIRRLHRIRRVLRRADPERNTVAGIAKGSGVWHLGRFAAEYRNLFGESPLETLKKTSPLAGVGGGRHLPQGSPARSPRAPGFD